MPNLNTASWNHLCCCAEWDDNHRLNKVTTGVAKLFYAPKQPPVIEKSDVFLRGLSVAEVLYWFRILALVLCIKAALRITKKKIWQHAKYEKSYYFIQKTKLNK